MQRFRARPFMLLCLPIYPLMGAMVLSGGWAKRWGGARWLWWAIGQGLGLLALLAVVLAVRSTRWLDALPSLELFGLAYAAGLLPASLTTLWAARPGDIPGPFQLRMIVS